MNRLTLKEMIVDYETHSEPGDTPPRWVIAARAEMEELERVKERRCMYNAMRKENLKLAQSQAAENFELRKEIEQLKRGEFICQKCGLRKDGEAKKGDF